MLAPAGSLVSRRRLTRPSPRLSRRSSAPQRTAARSCAPGAGSTAVRSDSASFRAMMSRSGAPVMLTISPSSSGTVIGQAPVWRRRADARGPPADAASPWPPRRKIAPGPARQPFPDGRASDRPRSPEPWAEGCDSNAPATDIGQPGAATPCRQEVSACRRPPRRQPSRLGADRSDPWCLCRSCPRVILCVNAYSRSPSPQSQRAGLLI